MTSDNYVITTSDVRMPKLIYGTAWKEARTAALVEEAISSGFRGIDTACQPKHYHEAGVGEGVASAIKRGLVERSELYLQTKFTPLDGQDPKRIPYDANASLREQVTQSLDVSLRNLHTHYLDCLVLHSPMTTQQQTHEAWQAMEGLVHTGKVKQLGISNCYDLKTLGQLYAFATVKPAVIQNRFHAKTDYDRTIRAFCEQQGIIYQSFWTLTANPHVLDAATLRDIATQLERTTAQVFFRYLTQIGIVPLTGTSSAIHRQEDLSIFSFELTAAECSVIGKLLLP